MKIGEYPGPRDVLVRRFPNPVPLVVVLCLSLAGCQILDSKSDQPQTVNLEKKSVDHVVEAAKESGEYAVAAGISQKYAENHPGDAGAQIASGQVALEAGRFDEAAIIFTTALQRSPNDVEASLASGAPTWRNVKQRTHSPISVPRWPSTRSGSMP